MKQLRISNIKLGDKVILIDDDTNSTCYAQLRDGGKSGGSEFDKYFAYLGEESEATDNTPYLRTDSEEAAKYSIAI